MSFVIIIIFWKLTLQSHKNRGNLEHKVKNPKFPKPFANALCSSLSLYHSCLEAKMVRSLKNPKNAKRKSKVVVPHQFKFSIVGLRFFSNCQRIHSSWFCLSLIKLGFGYTIDYVTRVQRKKMGHPHQIQYLQCQRRCGNPVLML